MLHNSGAESSITVRNQMVRAIAGVKAWLEDGNPLPGNLSPSNSADQLLGFAAKHAADDDFDPANITR